MQIKPILRLYLTPIRMANIEKKKDNKRWPESMPGTQEPPVLVVGVQTGAATTGISMVLIHMWLLASNLQICV